MAKRHKPRRVAPSRPRAASQPQQGRALRKADLATATHTPAVIEGTLVQAGMANSAQLGPGRPLNPYQGYSQPPRRTDYPVSVNISTQTRASWDRISYDTLRAIVKAYDVARICINHKIDELRSMEPMFSAADWARGDVDTAIEAARTALAFPDRELPYEDWLSKWMENALKFDAAPLYRRRNMDGEVIGLEVLDGTTVMPYIDEHGRKPEAPGPAYYQIIHGLPWNWYTRDDIDFRMFRPQEDSPFGLAPMESILLTANTDLRFQWHFLQMFTEGSVPAGFLELPPDISSPDQVAEWQDYWNAVVLGDQAKLNELIAVPSGTKLQETRPRTFDKTFPQYLMQRTCAAYGVVPQDVGLIEDVNRSNGETQTDIQFRVNTLPWVYWVQATLTRYLQYDLRLPVKVKLNTGRDVEDRVAEAQAWQIYIESGMASPDEGREKVLGLPVDKSRPTPRFFSTTRSGPIPLLAIEGLSGRTNPDTYGPADDQPIIRAPYVAPPGVIPAQGTADQQASTAAEDAYQTAMRQQLQAEGAQPDATPQTQDSAPAAPTATVTVPAQQVVKGAGELELAAFRQFVANQRRRGKWRDFEFRVLPDSIGTALNRDARADIVGLAKADPDPKDQAPLQGPESAQQWPGWQYDLAAAAYWAPLIATALGDAVDPRTVAAAFLAELPSSLAPEGESAEQREQRFQQAAERFTEQYRDAVERALRPMMPGVYTDGYAIGSASATSLVEAAERGMAEVAADMADWHPGNYEAAMLLIGRDADGSGLRDLLDKAQVEIKSIADARLNELGHLLAVGATRGDSADTIAADIRDLLTAQWRAEMIATTELSRAVSAAAISGYAQRGYRQIEWLTAEDDRVCPICDGNEEAGPIRIGRPFPSGALQPPGHPRCRCAVGVVISSRSQEGE